VVGERRARIKREYAASLVLPRRAGGRRRQEIADADYVKIEEFTCDLSALLVVWVDLFCSCLFAFSLGVFAPEFI
jgi:hypothetical protein